MSYHVPRPLPDPSKLPYGLVRITVWQPHPDIENQWSGKTYKPGAKAWQYERGSQQILNAGEVVDWSFDGYNLDYFNRTWLLEPQNDPGPLVRLAMWALDRWAVDQGLKEKTDKTRSRPFRLSW